MNLQLTPEQARAQLAGLQKQKDVVDKSIKMLAETGVALNDARIVDSDIRAIAEALANIVAVQILQLSLQQEPLALSIANIEHALSGSGIVLPTFLGPERKA